VVLALCLVGAPTGATATGASPPGAPGVPAPGAPSYGAPPPGAGAPGATPGAAAPPGRERPSTGGTLGPRPIDQLDRAVRQPPPSVPRPPAPSPRADMVWVPDRYLDRPEGTLHVPGHWEQRLSPQEHYVPPLHVCNRSSGECMQVLQGVRPPPEHRTGP